MTCSSEASSQLGHGFVIAEQVVTKIKIYSEMLMKWSTITNLISLRSQNEIWTHHVPDSLAIYNNSGNANIWLDIGSGSGFPSVIIACLLSKTSSALVNCVESDARKCTFLREVSATLRLPMRVFNTRIEELDPERVGSVEAITARAYSSVPRILSNIDPYLQQGASAFLPRGKSFRQDISLIDTQKYQSELRETPIYSAGRLLIITRKRASI